MKIENVKCRIENENYYVQIKLNKNQFSASVISVTKIVK